VVLIVAAGSMEDVMLLYIFWPSLCLGLMTLSAAAWAGQQTERKAQQIAARS
jgi:hypothetical protein